MEHALVAPRLRSAPGALVEQLLALCPTERFLRLTSDPASGITLGEQGTREAIVGILMEKQGKLSGPIRREPTGKAEFLDRRGVAFDVKSFRSDKPRILGGFDLERSIANITRKFDNNINIIMDTSALTPGDKRKLKAAVARAGYSRRVVWFDYPDLETAIVAMRKALFPHVANMGKNLSHTAPPLVLCNLSPAQQRKIALLRTAIGHIDVLPASLGNYPGGRAMERFPPAGLVAAAIRAAGLHGQCIRLLCAPPPSMPGYGQQLADHCGITVLVPGSRVWIHANGVMTTGKDPSDRDGLWHSFHPEVTRAEKR